MEALAKDLGVEPREVEARANKLHETNPMLGHRGVRLGISYPEIYEMQARAIFEAVAAVSKESGETALIFSGGERRLRRRPLGRGC